MFLQLLLLPMVYSQKPCRAGNTLASDHLTCIPCPIGTVRHISQLTCSPCTEGHAPNALRTACRPCLGKTFRDSTMFNCHSCPDDLLPNMKHTGCEAGWHDLNYTAVGNVGHLSYSETETLAFDPELNRLELDFTRHEAPKDYPYATIPSVDIRVIFYGGDGGLVGEVTLHNHYMESKSCYSFGGCGMKCDELDRVHPDVGLLPPNLESRRFNLDLHSCTLVLEAGKEEDPQYCPDGENFAEHMKNIPNISHIKIISSAVLALPLDEFPITTSYRVRGCDEGMWEKGAAARFFVKCGVSPDPPSASPWIVSVMNGRRNCSGTLIDARTVITSSRCVSGHMDVVAGDQKVVVAKGRPSGNLTVLKLKTPLTLGRFAWPACLAQPDMELQPGALLMVSWVPRDGSSGCVTRGFPYMCRDSCREEFGKDVPAHEACLWPAQGLGHGAGVGLVKGGVYTLVGVGESTGEEGAGDPTLFTDLRKFSEFVNSVRKEEPSKAE